VGHPRVRFIVRPRGDWGALQPRITRGSNHLRFELPSGTLRLNSNAPLTYLLDSTWFSLQAPVSLMLGPDETLPGASRTPHASSRSRPRSTGGTGRGAWPCRSNGRTP
jgi:hypothetical protein